VQPNPLDAADPQGQQRPLILEPAVLALDRPTEPVELLPAQRGPGDQGVSRAPSFCESVSFAT
jgi:hypothetical protein